MFPKEIALLKETELTSADKHKAREDLVLLLQDVIMAGTPRGRYGVFNPHTYGVFTPHTIRLVGMSNVPKGDCVVEGDRTYECRQTEGRRRPGVVLHEFVLLQRPSKFIRLGAKQIISSSTTDKLPTTAFLNLDGKIAVVVLNLTD
jgi:hypothetical protein